MEQDDLRDRIKQIMEMDNKNSITFSEAIGIQQSTLSHILKGRNRPSLDVIMKIHQQYPNISYNWLLSGQGSMTSEMPMADEDHPVQNMHSRVPDSLNLFTQNAENPTYTQGCGNNFQNTGFQQPIEQPKEIVRQEIKYVEKPARKIVEIRIFFDDNTYQIFTCGN